MKIYKRSIAIIILLFISLVSTAQQSIFYQRAKESCLLAASKTKCPEKAAHFRKMADWNQCMIDQLAGKKVTCVDVSGTIPFCEADQVGSGSNGQSSLGNSSANTTKSVDPAKIAGQLNAVSTLLDSSSNQTDKNNAMDLLMGNPIGATNNFLTILDFFSGSRKKEKITSDLILSYKKLKDYFDGKYGINYDDYILAIKEGNYEQWRRLYKPEIDINTVLIHNLPPSYDFLYLGNIALVAAYYGNAAFLLKLLDEFPNVGLNYKDEDFPFCEALEIAIISKRLDIAKILLDHGAIVLHKGFYFKSRCYEEQAKAMGNFEIASLLTEYRSQKNRPISKYFDKKFIGWEDENVKYLVKKSRDADRLDFWARKKILPRAKSINPSNENTKQPFSLADELKKLKDLLDTGVINKEEFESAKKKLLDNN